MAIGRHFSLKVIETNEPYCVVYLLKLKNSENSYVDQTVRICNIRLNIHKTTKESHFYEQNNIPARKKKRYEKQHVSWRFDDVN